MNRDNTPFPNFSYKKLHTVSLRKVRHAVHYFNMLEPGDRVIVGVSGGVDSLALLSLFGSHKNNWMEQIEIIPLHIAAGFPTKPDELNRLKDYCDRLGLPLRIEYRDIESKAFAENAPFNPCFICSRMRRKALFETAELMGATKVALGHHMDDLIETFFINLIYGRELAGFMAKQELFAGKYHIIRPMFLLEKAHIEGLHTKRPFPVLSKICPLDGSTKRDRVRMLLKSIYSENPKLKKNIFKALFHVKHEYLLENFKDLLGQI